MDLKIKSKKFKIDFNRLNLSKKQKEDLKKSLINAKKTLTKHFKNDGWDLDAHHIVSDILYDVFGPINDYLLIELIQKNTFLTTSDKFNLVYRKEK